jgi:predicted acyl esterase
MATRRSPGRSDFWITFSKTSTMGWIEYRRYVRLEIRKGFYQQEVRSEPSWPIASAEPTLLYLCANTHSLQKEPVASEGTVQHESTNRNGTVVSLADSSRMLN